jgi:hypothetical protein
VSTPRTWRLSEREGRSGGTLASTEVGGIRVKPENECSFTDEILIEVIEKEPVLDLLERCVRAASVDRCCDGVGCWRDKEPTFRDEGGPPAVALAEAEALLAANGRLKADSDE